VFFRVEILPFLLFSTILFFAACDDARLLIDLRFRERQRKAAPAKNTRTEDRSSKSTFFHFNNFFIEHPPVLVFCAGATSNLPPKKLKYISTRVTAQAKKSKRCENVIKGRIFTQKK
jgi:hypothetical protein